MRRQPSARSHSPLHMRAMHFGRPWLFPAMPNVIAVPTSGNNIVSGIHTTFRTRVEMLGRASQVLWQGFRSAVRLRDRVSSIIPHRQAAVIATAALCDHLFLSYLLQCSHDTGTPFDFVKSECATPT
jgi:hypothetical protein